MIGMLLLSIAQLYAGYVGIEDGWGVGWAVGALACAAVLRFTLPITVGAFFAARDVWDWHWALAALFAAPGLLFMVPGLVAALVGQLRK
jgi:hypothetical protein